MPDTFPPEGYYLRIKDWEEHFEKSQSKRVAGPLSWLPLPTRQDGLKFSRLMRRKDGVTVLGTFILMLEIAAKCEPRGSFITKNGKMMTSSDFSEMSRAPRVVFDRSIKVLISDEIGWLELGAFSEMSPSVLGARSTLARARDIREREHDNTIQNKTREREDTLGVRSETGGRGHTHSLDFSSLVPNGKSTAVEMVKEVLGTIPIPVLQERMVEVIQDLELWRETLLYWRNNKHNQNSHGLMLDRYEEQFEKRRRKSSGEDDAYAAVRERIRRESTS